MTTATPLLRLAVLFMAAKALLPQTNIRQNDTLLQCRYGAKILAYLRRGSQMDTELHGLLKLKT